MMDKVIYGDLVILGDLICGNTGILEASGDISWNYDLSDECHGNKHNLVDKVLSEGKSAMIYNEDLEIEDQHIKVHGNVHIWGYTKYDSLTYQGYVSAGCKID